MIIAQKLKEAEITEQDSLLLMVAQKLKEAEITEEPPKPSRTKYFNVKSVPALDMETRRVMPMDAESRRFIDWMEKDVYDALQRRYLKTLMFSICKSVYGPMIDEYSFSFIFPDSEGQDVVMNIHKKQGGTFNDIIPNQMSYMSSASKMVHTLVQLMRTLDKMPDERTIVMKLLYYDDVTAQDYEGKSTGPGSVHDGSFGQDETQGPAEDEQRLARVKDSLNSHHLDMLKLTDDSQPSDYSRRKSGMVLGSGRRTACKFFAQGLCQHGDRCLFLHSYPPREVVCKYFQAGRCNNGDKCRYLHSSPPREVVCKYFLQGRCHKGDKCIFLHQEPNMDIPKKSEILERLPKNIRQRLKKKYSVEVSSQIAKRCLDGGREEYVDDTVSLKLSDRNNFLVMFWVRETEWRAYLVERAEGTPTRITTAIGRIRNQDRHNACWSYADTDLVAGTRLLHGLDEEFRALCTRYLIQNVDREEYIINLKRAKSHRRDHACFGCSLEMGLAYIQKFGIPEEEPGYALFSCLEERRINRSHPLYKIEGFYQYETLDQALVRLRTHPVGATLYGFKGWDGPGIYRGPMKEDAEIEGLHAVVMCELRMIDGEPVIFCKSSNGDDLGGVEGFQGFIAVAANVMIMIMGKETDDDNEGHRVCPRKPSSLLTGFYSVEMPYKDPSFDLEDPKAKEENQKFKVDISEYDWQIDPKFEEDQRRQTNPRKRGRHCR